MQAKKRAKLCCGLLPACAIHIAHHMRTLATFASESIACLTLQAKVQAGLVCILTRNRPHSTSILQAILSGADAKRPHTYEVACSFMCTAVLSQ